MRATNDVMTQLFQKKLLENQGIGGAGGPFNTPGVIRGTQSNDNSGPSGGGIGLRRSLTEGVAAGSDGPMNIQDFSEEMISNHVAKMVQHLKINTNLATGNNANGAANGASFSSVHSSLSSLGSPGGNNNYNYPSFSDPVATGGNGATSGNKKKSSLKSKFGLSSSAANSYDVNDTIFEEGGANDNIGTGAGGPKSAKKQVAGSKGARFNASGESLVSLITPLAGHTSHSNFGRNTFAGRVGGVGVGFMAMESMKEDLHEDSASHHVDFNGSSPAKGGRYTTANAISAKSMRNLHGNGGPFSPSRGGANNGSPKSKKRPKEEKFHLYLTYSFYAPWITVRQHVISHKIAHKNREKARKYKEAYKRKYSLTGPYADLHDGTSTAAGGGNSIGGGGDHGGIAGGGHDFHSATNSGEKQAPPNFGANRQASSAFHLATKHFASNLLNKQFTGANG